MDALKASYYGFVDFCTRVVQWRSAATVPYIFAVNAAFWATVYYATTETQMKSLASLAFIIFGNDVLFSPTHDRSIFVQILLWPIRDLWKTSAVVLCGVGIHQLRESKDEEAFWCSLAAVVFILISPVYKYNKVNRKIVNAWLAAGSLIKSLLTYCIVRPILYAYEGLKYVFLFRWVSDLIGELRLFRAFLYNNLDRLVLQQLRAFGSKCADIFRYWFYFRWVADLKSFIYIYIGYPVLQKLRIARDYFVYVFGGYWFFPVMRSFGRMSWSLSCYFAKIANQCALVIGSNVVWPITVVASSMLQEVGVNLYDVAGRPVANILHQKYKIIENATFIYVIGPTVKALLDCIPEKNPFCSEDDRELDEFLPGPVGDANADDEELVSRRDSTDDLSDEMQIRDEDFDDLDDDRFLAKRLQRDFSGSDSSEEEFLLFPSKKGSKRRPTTTTTTT